MSMTSSNVSNKKNLMIITGTILVGGFFNSLGSLANVALGSPLFFDSIFTAISGALFGPWAGVLCGVATHIFLIAFHGWDIAWMFFLPCSIATGVITGVFAARKHLKGALDVILCSVLVTLANSFLGAIIGIYAYGGVTTHPSDYLITGLILVGQSVLAASFWARIPLNLIDKGIAVAVAFAVLKLVMPWLIRNTELK
jgi:energy-coupling factor transport system substrate-specific component